MSTRESTIEKNVCDYARKNSIEVYKLTSPGRAGVPDRMFIDPYGFIFFIEFKTEKGVLSPRQRREISIMRKRGVFVYVVHSEEDGRKIISKYIS